MHTGLTSRDYCFIRYILILLIASEVRIDIFNNYVVLKVMCIFIKLILEINIVVT